MGGTWAKKELIDFSCIFGQKCGSRTFLFTFFNSSWISMKEFRHIQRTDLYGCVQFGAGDCWALAVISNFSPWPKNIVFSIIKDQGQFHLLTLGSWNQLQTEHDSQPRPDPGHSMEQERSGHEKDEWCFCPAESWLHFHREIVHILTSSCTGR